jgi:hypothetical protein
LGEIYRLLENKVTKSGKDHEESYEHKLVEYGRKSKVAQAKMGSFFKVIATKGVQKAVSSSRKK